MVLDVMLPGKDGFTVAADLRAARNFIPILMLTARGRPEDVLQGFASGADDYLPKPFELAILIARLESLLRRSVWMKDRNRPGSGKGDGHDDDNDLDKSRRPSEGVQGTGSDTISFGGKTAEH